MEVLGKGFCFALFLKWGSKGHKSTQQPAFYAALVRARLRGHLSLQKRLGKEPPGKGVDCSDNVPGTELGFC